MFSEFFLAPCHTLCEVLGIWQKAKNKESPSFQGTHKEGRQIEMQSFFIKIDVQIRDLWVVMRHRTGSPQFGGRSRLLKGSRGSVEILRLEGLSQSKNGGGQYGHLAPSEEREGGLKR